MGRCVRGEVHECDGSILRRYKRFDTSASDLRDTTRRVIYNVYEQPDMDKRPRVMMSDGDGGGNIVSGAHGRRGREPPFV